MYFSGCNVFWGLPDSRCKKGNQAGSQHLCISGLFPLSMLVPWVSGLVCQLASMSKCSSPKLSGSFKIQSLAGKPVLQFYLFIFFSVNHLSKADGHGFFFFNLMYNVCFCSGKLVQKWLSNFSSRVPIFVSNSSTAVVSSDLWSHLGSVPCFESYLPRRS